MERGHELEKLHANRNGNSVSQPSAFQLKAVRWDVSFVDRLLFPGTTIIFGICTITLLLTRAFFALVGEIDASCWCPAAFTENFVEYANRFCLRSTSLREIETSNLQPNFNSKGTPGGLARGGIFTTLWFMVTQFMTAVVGLVLFIWLYTWGRHMTIRSHSSSSLIPQQKTALCDFSIRQIGNVQWYTLQCLFVKTDARDVIEYGVYQLCLVWSVFILTAAVLNAAIVLILAILASCKSKIVSWYIGHEDRQFENKLSWSAIFVCLLAGRCGDGLMVGQILQTAYSEMKQD